jgi:osmotically-inducible protein OsmY
VADAVITTKIKADLFAEPELKALAIDVDTENGVVNLSGFVSSKAEAEKAERLAKGVKGVTNVKNSLKVK